MSNLNTENIINIVTKDYKLWFKNKYKFNKTTRILSKIHIIIGLFCLPFAILSPLVFFLSFVFFLFGCSYLLDPETNKFQKKYTKQENNEAIELEKEFKKNQEYIKSILKDLDNNSLNLLTNYPEIHTEFKEIFKKEINER